MFSDAESVYTVMSQLGVEGGLPAWPEESEEYGLESFTATGAADHDGGQQYHQQWGGGDDGGRSSSTSCVTALSDDEEQQHDNALDHSNSMNAAMHEAHVQQLACGAVAVSGGRGNVVATANYPATGNIGGKRHADPTCAVSSGPKALAGLPSSVESAPLHQVLSSAGGGDMVDLNTMTVGDLLRALTQAVMRRQFI